jgi:hypothetical protein
MQLSNRLDYKSQASNPTKTPTAAEHALLVADIDAGRCVSVQMFVFVCVCMCLCVCVGRGECHVGEGVGKARIQDVLKTHTD